MQSSGGGDSVAKKHDRQKKAFSFLKQQPHNTWFDIADIDQAAGWKSGTAVTNISKYWRGWVKHNKKQATVLPEFGSVSEVQFLRQSVQKRMPFANFKPHTYDHVAVYEFLLPLTRETQLRAALDGLFYRDDLVQRLNEIGDTALHRIMPLESGEASDAYRARILRRIASLFGGYSIGHVSGRFRAAPLQSRKEAAIGHKDGHPYLIDETTALVRFIVPLEIDESEDANGVAKQVRSLFMEVFVKTVVRTVGGEEEVWFVEHSPLGTKLHVYEKP